MKDAAGREITVGCYLFYAATFGRSAVMNLMLVTELRPGRAKPIVGEAWWPWDKWRKVSKLVMLGFPDRCVVVDPATLPEGVK